MAEKKPDYKKRARGPIKGIFSDIIGQQGGRKAVKKKYQSKDRPNKRK